MSYLRYLCLFAYSGFQRTVLCFVLSCLEYPMLPVSLNGSFFIAPSLFSNVYLEDKNMTNYNTIRI